MNFHKVTLGFYHYVLLIVKRYQKLIYHNKILFITRFYYAKIYLLIKKSKFEFVFSHKMFLKLQTVHATITG